MVSVDDAGEPNKSSRDGKYHRYSLCLATLHSRLAASSDDDICMFVCLSVCRQNRVHTEAVFSKTMQYSAKVTYTGD